MIHQLRSLFSSKSNIWTAPSIFPPKISMLGVLSVKAAPAPLVPNIYALFATCSVAGSASICGVREGKWLAELGGNTCMVWLEWVPDAVHSTTLLITAMTWQEVQHQAGTLQKMHKDCWEEPLKCPKKPSPVFFVEGQAVGLLTEPGGIALNLA